MVANNLCYYVFCLKEKLGILLFIILSSISFLFFLLFHYFITNQGMQHSKTEKIGKEELFSSDRP